MRLWMILVNVMNYSADTGSMEVVDTDSVKMNIRGRSKQGDTNIPRYMRDTVSSESKKVTSSPIGRKIIHSPGAQRQMTILKRITTLNDTPLKKKRKINNISTCSTEASIKNILSSPKKVDIRIPYVQKDRKNFHQLQKQDIRLKNNVLENFHIKNTRKYIESPRKRTSWGKSSVEDHISSLTFNGANRKYYPKTLPNFHMENIIKHIESPIKREKWKNSSVEDHILPSILKNEPLTNSPRNTNTSNQIYPYIPISKFNEYTNMVPKRQGLKNHIPTFSMEYVTTLLNTDSQRKQDYTNDQPHKNLSVKEKINEKLKQKRHSQQFIDDLNNIKKSIYEVQQKCANIPKI